MEKIKVLFLTYYYPPQKCPRSIQISHLVQYLRHHFSLRVITSYPEKAGDQSLLKFTPLDNVNYAPKSLLTNFIEKSKGDRIKKAVLPDFQYLWHRDLYSKTKRIIEEAAADIIVTFGQPMSTHIAGLKLKEKYPHLKWLAHFSDPWIDNLFNDYTRWVKFANTYYQNAVFKNADRLIFTSQETIELVMRKYASEIHSKALYLPHIFDENLYHSQKKEKKEGSFFKIRYIGNFYGARQPDCLLKALQHFPKSQLQNIQIEFVGAATTDVNNKIRHYGLEETVLTLPPISYLDSLALMQTSDLLLIIDAPAEISPFLPSKLIDYIGANKPILGITPPGASQRLIEEMGFMVAPPNNSDAIAKNLIKTIQNIKDKKFTAVPEKIRQRYFVKTVGDQMKTMLYDASLPPKMFPY